MPNSYVSVLIDTYNHERFVERAISSVLEQDMPMEDVEVVVVDDGSTDGTPEIVRRFEPRVRLLQKPNGGQASAFNLALPKTQGQVIAMLDGDDWWAPQKLRRALETLAANPDVGIVGHGYVEAHTNGQPNRLVLPGQDYRLDLSSLANAELFRHLLGFLGTSKMTIRRSVLERILPVPEALVVEADEYIFTLAPAISPAIVLNEPLFYYGFHDGNLFQFAKYDPAKARGKMMVLETLMQRLPPKLRELGIAQEIIDSLFIGTGVEAARLRLSVEGGNPVETFLVERAALKVAYRQVSLRYTLFRAFVLSLALLLPPRLFYGFRRWYSAKGLSRLRNWTGEPVRAVEVDDRSFQQ